MNIVGLLYAIHEHLVVEVHTVPHIADGDDHGDELFAYEGVPGFVLNEMA